MKNLKFLVLAIVLMFGLINVNALDVTNFEGLKQCLAGSETTCTVKDDISLTGTETEKVNETLTLNGKTVVLEKTIVVNEYATLTINGDGKVEGAVETGLINIKNGGTLIVNGGSFTNTAEAAKCFGIYGTATDNGVKTTLTIGEGVNLVANYGILVGRVGTDSSYGVVVNYAGNFEGLTGNGNYKNGNIGITTNGNITAKTGNVPVINITGGSITGVEGTSGDVNYDDSPAVYAAGYAIWNISGGTLTGSEALSIKAGEFNITGGTFRAFGEVHDPAEPNSNASEATGAAISITANKNYAKNVTLNIEDATVESENGYAVYEGTSNDLETAVKSMEISGGEFAGKDEALEVKNVTEFVTGGSFNSDLSNSGYLSDDTNLVTKEDENGNYLVGVEHTITVNNANNGTVVADKDKAVAGETVTLTITPNKDYLAKPAEVVIVGTNETVEIVNGKFVMPDADVEITVAFEAVPNPDTSDNVMIYLVLGMISLIALVVGINKVKRFN